MHFGALPAYKDAMEQQVFKDYIETNIAIKALYQQKDAVNWLNSINGSAGVRTAIDLSLIHISEPTRQEAIS